MPDNPLLGGGAPAPTPAPVSAPAPATPVAAPPTPASATPVPSAAPAPEPGAPPSAAPALAPEPQRFKLKVDGQDLEVDLEEMKRGYIGSKTWTQRSQQLAEERRRFVAEQEAFQARQNAMRGELEKLQQLMTDPAQLERYLTILRASSGYQSQGQPDLEAPVSKAEFQVALQKQLATQQQAFQAELRRMSDQMTQMQRHREVTGHSLVFDKFLEKFIGENPGLTELYDPAELFQSIKAEAGQRVAFAAQTGQDVRDWQELSLRELESAAKRRLERVQPYLQNKAKLEAIAAPAAQVPGMVPPTPGATAPVPQPKPALKLGSKEMLEKVQEFVTSGGQTQ